MDKKFKTYVLMLSRVFPKTHPRTGEPTDFKPKKEKGIKKHTIRGNAALWEHRADEINAGRAELSVRQWSGKPYEPGSHQIEIARLTRLGTQRVTLPYFYSSKLKAFIPVCVKVWRDDGSCKVCYNSEVAVNDGLSLKDFLAWFKRKGRKNKPVEDFNGVILHFTDMRY